MFDEDEMNAWFRAVAAERAAARPELALPSGGEALPSSSGAAIERLRRELSAVDGAIGAFIERWMADELVHADQPPPGPAR